MGPGGSLGLQIRSRVVIPAEVGSTPTRFRHFVLKTKTSEKEVVRLTDKEIKRLTHMSSKAG